MPLVTAKVSASDPREVFTNRNRLVRFILLGPQVKKAVCAHLVDLSEKEVTYHVELVYGDEDCLIVEVTDMYMFERRNKKVQNALANELAQIFAPAAGEIQGCEKVEVFVHPFNQTKNGYGEAKIRK